MEPTNHFTRSAEAISLNIKISVVALVTLCISSSSAWAQKGFLDGAWLRKIGIGMMQASHAFNNYSQSLQIGSQLSNQNQFNIFGSFSQQDTIRESLLLPPYVLKGPMLEPVGLSMEYTHEQLLLLYRRACLIYERGDSARAVKSFEILAKKGLAEAQYSYGYCLLNTNNKRQIASGVKWISSAADQGNADASYCMGVIYLNGIGGVPQDSVKSKEWILKSADEGCYYGQVYIGNAYLVDCDYVDAAKYYTMAFMQKQSYSYLEEQKAVLAQIAFNLGVFSCEGKGEPYNLRKAARYFEWAAGRGHAEAAYILGLLYYEGSDELGQNNHLAKRYLKTAANFGHTGAPYWLTLLYNQEGDNENIILWGSRAETRDSVDCQYAVGYAFYNKGDYENAVNWFKKAAEQNYVEPCCMLAYIYENNLNDSISAFQYIKKAAELGYDAAINDLGTYYVNGEFVDRNIPLAIEYFSKAAEMNLPSAYHNLGVVYYNKEFGVKNLKRAAEYWKHGAELGDPNSQYCYSLVLKKGKGVKKDKAQAAYWKQLAAQNGIEE